MKKPLFIALAFLPLTSSAAKSTNPAIGGRFQLVQLGDMRRDQFLLDTETGKIWGPSCTKVAADKVGCDGTRFFTEIPVEGISINSKEIRKLFNEDNQRTATETK